MSLFCAISGVPTKNSVVSPKSGHVFEYELIKQYIEEHGKDPINNEVLSIDELIKINSTTAPFQPPRQSTLNSIPSLLSALQNEWDSTALELFSLRKTLEDTRKELSTALYHHDAAVRVASRALKERDEARKALEDLSISISGGGTHEALTKAVGNGDSQITDSSIPQDISDQITKANEELFQKHKSEKKKPNVSISHEFVQLSQDSQTSKPFKKIIQSTSNKSNGSFVITSTTGISSVYDKQTQKYVKDDTILKKKDISTIHITPQGEKILGLSNGSIWVNENNIPTNHKSTIISILQHPSLDNLITTIDKDGLYSILDLSSEAVVYNNSINIGAQVADIHLDGALVAIGDVEGKIHIIDLRSGEVVSTLNTNVDSSDVLIKDLKFGTNGYWLFASLSDSKLDVWDLRKNTSSRVATNQTIKKFTFDKSSQIIVGINDSEDLEIIQYNKTGKSWIDKGVLKLDKSNDIFANLSLVDDSEQDKLVVDVLSETSEVRRVTIS